MTEIVINDSDRRIQYTATAAQTVFPYDFPIFDQAHLVVTRLRAGVLTTLALTTDYTVSGVGVVTGGNVTLVTGATLDDVITVYGNTPVERTTDFNDAGDFFAATLNRELDLQTQMIQQNERDIARSLRLQDGDTSTSSLLPLAAARASKFLAFDASGDPVAAAGTSADLGPVTPFIDTLLDDATAAVARSTLGAETAGAAAAVQAAAVMDGDAAGGDLAGTFPSPTVVAASTTVAGKSELATTAETQAGSDAARTTTPAGIFGALGFINHYNSGNQTVALNGTLTLAHGMARTPVLVCLWLKCLTAEFGYSIGDKVLFLSALSTSAADNYGVAVIVDATNVTVEMGNNANTFNILRRDTRVSAPITDANWAIVVDAWA